MLTEMPLGKQAIAFDRLDLDAWADEYKERNGRPGKGGALWDAREHQVSTGEGGSGESTNVCTDDDWQKALEQATSQKRTPISPDG